MRNARLIAPGIPALPVNRAEHLRRLERIHEGARPIIDGLAADGHIVRVHHTMDEPDTHPLRNQTGLAGRDSAQEFKRRLF